MVVDTSNGSLTLAEQLRRELATRYNVEIVSRRTEAQVVVHLDEVQFNRIVVGFSRAGRPREIELRMALLLRIEDAQGSLLQPAGQLELRLTVAIADADVISTDDAERFQREVMTQDLLQQIMRRLGRIGHDAGSARPR
jgi:outer membrane lipopolysaccharide assembly protein LptE/RlpB